MKKTIIFLMAILMAANVWAVTYPYNYYDDFTTLNTSIWQDVYGSGSFTINNLKLYANSTPTGFFENLKFLPDVDFSKDYVIEYNLTFLDTYASAPPTISQDSFNLGANRSTMLWSTYCNGNCASLQLYVSEYLSGATYNTPIVGTLSLLGVWKLQKTNLPNGLYNYKIYFNNTLEYDKNGSLNYTPYKDFVKTMYLWVNTMGAGNNGWEIDWINITVTEPSNGTPTPAYAVTLNSPTTNTRSNEQLNVSFSANENSNCSLYIGGQVNNTLTGLTADTNYSIISDLGATGFYQWYVNCTNGVDTDTTTSYLFNYDINPPAIQTATPSVFNTTTFTGFSMDITGNVTDDSIFRVNRTIRYPNGSVYYNNYSGDLVVNTTLYSWSDTFNTTDEPNGVWTMFIEAADSHTAKFLKSAKDVKADNIKKQLAYTFNDKKINVTLIDGNVLGQFENISTNKLYDRYNFEVNFKNELQPNRLMVFRVESDSELVILEGSPYPAHMITGNYWIDFAGVEGAKYNVIRRAKNVVDVEITTGSKQKFVFESLGGLNENNVSISFEVNNCIPSWACDGYGACNISDLAPCNSVVDNNACGLPYSGDYSEFSAQPCNYCSYSLTLINTTACVDGTQQVLYVDSNFLACCDLTGLPSDCAFGNQSSGVVNQSCSAFTGQYVTGDITAVVTDGIVAFGIGIVSLMGIIGLVVLFRWGRKQVKVR